MGELWRWNGHRTRSDRSQEHAAPRRLFLGDTVPRRLCLGNSAQEHTIPRRLCLGDSAYEHPVPRSRLLLGDPAQEHPVPGNDLLGTVLGRVRSWEYSPGSSLSCT